MGSVLSADVFARYLRMRGNRVVFVSGSDEHGTVIEVEAIKRGLQPKDFTDQAHSYILKLWESWEISFDNYTRTESEVHKEFVREFLLEVQRNGYIDVREQSIPWCPKDRLYLPDRFVSGTCPYCGYPDAHGDQCDACGRILDPDQLINPRCVFCGSRPEFISRKHWFFRLDKLGEALRELLTSHKLLSDKVKSYSLAWVTSGLKPRALTRDTSWGIPAPFEGAEGKTVYVWFDALLGYISATKEYFIVRGRPEEWLELWLSRDTMTAYFIGKDNIPFHAVIFPALILASGRGYKLPDLISATEYLLYEGEKFSKSRRVGIWADEALEIFGEAEYWRFALMRMRPEDRDTSFKWTEFVRIVNTELNDDIGNFIHRVLTLIWRYFNGVIPEISAPTGEDEAALKTLRDSWLRYCRYIELGEIRKASEVIVELARFGNQYITRKAPWFKIKEDVNDVKNTLRVSFEICLHIAVMLYPFMPRLSRTLLDTMGVELREELVVRDTPRELLREGHRIKEPRVVFTKIPKDLAEALLDPEKRETLIRSARERTNARRPQVLRF